VPARISAKRLLLGGGANPFCEWDPADGKELRLWGGPKGPIASLARDSGGALISAGNEGVLFRCEKNGQQSTAWRAHDQAINAVATNKNRSLLLTASADRTVKLHNAGKGMPVCTLAGHTSNVTSVAFGDTDDWAASAGDDRAIILWDLEEGKKRHIFEGHADSVNAIAVSPKGDWLASASSDNTVRLWPIKDGKPDADRDPLVLEAHKKPVTCIAFSADGKTLLSAGQDQTIKLWDVAKQEVIHEMIGHKNWISAAIFHGDGLVISASDDLTVRLWNSTTGKEVDRIDLSTVSDGPRSLLSLNNDGFAVGTSGWVVMRFATQ
jgi:WD40 repeat protein